MRRKGIVRRIGELVGFAGKDVSVHGGTDPQTSLDLFGSRFGPPEYRGI